MTWEKYDDSGTRWSWSGDEERHLLWLDEPVGVLREYHEQPDGPATVHEYAVNALWDAAEPLAAGGCAHVHTAELPPEDGERVRQLNNTKLFEYLEVGKTW